jgi:hypothetical protein
MVAHARAYHKREIDPIQRSLSGSTGTCMSSRASMTSRWQTRASDRELRIPPIGDLIRGIPAPEGTWPDHELAPADVQEQWRGPRSFDGRFG